MRFVSLDLAAFGPFTDRTLVLEGGTPGGLHLVFGKNAAGKSSALRAISDLLFGIPPKSADDHVHPYTALRIRATLESSGGERLVVQRLKRNKDSLRDQEDAPLDEMVIKRLLGSVDRAMFERVFGLDHERLRDAGQILLEGGGDVGESLFDAGAGGQGIRRVLARLREEAERLFKPRGGKQEIVQLLESYKAARERVRNSAHAPEAYVEQERGLERHRLEGEALWRELNEHRQERERCKNLQRALKGITKRAILLKERDALGALPQLPADFGERRERVQRSLLNHEANIARAEHEIARLEQRSRELQPPMGLLEVGEEAITLLREGIGSTKKALQDLPAREATLAERRAEAQIMERQLEVEASRLNPSAIRARRPEESRFRKLLAERAASAERRRAIQERLAQAELDWETQKARLGVLAEPSGGEALEYAVLLSRQMGDVEGALLSARRERAEIALLSEAELATLDPFNGNLAELCRLRVPAAETVQLFERSFAAIEDQRRSSEEALSRCRGRSADLSRELAAEERAGAVPSEAELERARSARDENFDELCRAWPEAGKKTLSLFEAARVREYRSQVGKADSLADRLRREAARVAENARRVAELAQLAEEQTRLTDLDVSLRREAERLAEEWSSSWAAAGFQPVRPAEMRGWLARRESAVALVVREAAVVERKSELERREAELRQALASALGQLPDATPLSVCVERALEKLTVERKLAAERGALNAQLAELEVRRVAAKRDLQASEGEWEALERKLADVIGALGFQGSISPEEVEARLEMLAEWLRAREQIEDLDRRVSGMKRDILAFEADVKTLVLAHAPDVAELPSQRAASELVSRFDRGRRDFDVLAGLHKDLHERKAELDEQRALIAQAKSEAEGLLSVAGTSDMTQLSAVESRTQKARELGAEIGGLEATLSETAGTRGLEAFLDEASATDPARLSARLEELDDLIQKLEDRHEDSIRGHQSIQAGLERFSDTSAMEAAEEERALASALVARSERWAKLKLAEVLLAREIERYREQNQGPVLRRAGELFTRLTGGEHKGLRVGREERTLVAVRSNDLEVSVEGLNEAARYHLYLALRLASLERYLEHAEPLPLVLDDVLIHFDDDGARAALGVLGELAAKVQILLFTHHRHNIELAQASVPAARLFTHEL